MDYPGGHGAPDIYRPVHHGMHTGIMPSRSQPYNDHEVDVAEPIMVSYRQNQPGVNTLDDGIHKQAHPWGSDPTFLLSHGTYNPFQNEHTTDQVQDHPRGHSVINRKSNLEEVKHVAPPNLADAPGQSGIVGWDTQGRNKPLSFVHNEHDLAIDESVPNRHGVPLSGLSLPQSWGHAASQRVLTGYGPGRKVPGFASKDHIRAMRQGPAVTRLKRIRLPGLNVKQFVQNKPAFRRMIKPRSGPVWINQ